LAWLEAVARQVHAFHIGLGSTQDHFPQSQLSQHLPGTGSYGQPTLFALYAYNMLAFLSPIKLDLKVVKSLLVCFCGASGLEIECGQACHYGHALFRGGRLQFAVKVIPCALKHFACTYLVLPLSTFKLRKHDFQPPLDKVLDEVPGWKGRLTVMHSILHGRSSTALTLLVLGTICLCSMKWMFTSHVPRYS
jgi:hypothetical protein